MIPLQWLPQVLVELHPQVTGWNCFGVRRGVFAGTVWLAYALPGVGARTAALLPLPSSLGLPRAPYKCPTQVAHRLTVSF